MYLHIVAGIVLGYTLQFDVNCNICHLQAPSFILPYIYEKPAPTNGKFNNVSDKNTKSSVESTLVHLTSELGRNLAQEFVEQDMVMKELEKPKKDRNETTISALVENLKQMKEDNSIFHFNVKNCPACAFQTESTLALENHMEKIHKTLNQDFQKELLNMTDLDFYRCNICYYQTKNPQEIMKHIQEEMTKIDKQRSTKTASQFETPIFLFDDRLRGKLCFL